MSSDLASLIPRQRDRTALAKLGIETLEDALRHFPRRWVDPGVLTSIRGLSEFEEGEDVVIHARVVDVASRRMRNRRGSIATVTVTDDWDGGVEAVFFNQPWITRRLEPGMRIVISAKTKSYRGELQLSSPTILTGEGRDADAASRGGEDGIVFAPTAPIPVYPAGGGMTSTRIAGIISVLLDAADLDALDDPIPAAVREARGLPGFAEALRAMHRPTTMAEPQAAMRRWKFEEALAVETVLLRRRRAYDALEAGPLPGGDGAALAAFDDHLPYELTDSQRAVGETIAAELAGVRPMNRLLHGDVGSGKTLVALRAMLQAVDSGAQAAMIAPTEVLAAQHLRSITHLLGDLGVESSLWRGRDGIRAALLTGSMPTAERRRVLLDLASGEIDILVGTHALLSETTIFAQLGLVVVDEQHRFGVEQRAALRQKAGGLTPHMLVMTATPIPRTAAMTVFGDLDASVLGERPGGEPRIRTFAVSLAAHPSWTERICELIAEQAAAGHPSFAVLPRIETGEEGQPGVDDFARILAARPQLAGLTIETLHGQMAPEEKEDRMARTASGEIDVLVATTVIEVGIDIPQARVMLVVDADRFGVAQLHQLRGRVGRDGGESMCFLTTTAEPGTEAMERLETVAGTLDGFALAEYDLRTRREGDVLGRSQWGSKARLRHLSVVGDAELIAAAREDAGSLLDADPELAGHPGLAALIDRLVDDDAEEMLEAG